MLLDDSGCTFSVYCFCQHSSSLNLNWSARNKLAVDFSTYEKKSPLSFNLLQMCTIASHWWILTNTTRQQKLGLCVSVDVRWLITTFVFFCFLPLSRVLNNVYVSVYTMYYIYTFEIKFVLFCEQVECTY